MRARRDLKTANPVSRDPLLLHPLLQDALPSAEALGFGLHDGYCSRERQAELYARGRSEPGRIATLARPGESLQQYGLAMGLGYARGGFWSWDRSAPWSQLDAVMRERGLIRHAQELGLYAVCALEAARAGRFPAHSDAPRMDAWRRRMSELASGRAPRWVRDSDFHP